MMLQINKVHWPVTVLGYGRRIGIWFQGCSLKCKGCVSQDTWDKASGAQISLSQLMAWFREVSEDQLDGITISGGEPFEQAPQLMALVEAIQDWKQQIPSELDILCYSGYSHHILAKKYPTILAKLDALIAEPYIESLDPVHLRGSANQSLIVLSELAKQRYQQPAFANRDQKRFQIQLDDQHIWFIGIPGSGDMQYLQARCAEMGLSLGDVSWRS